MTPQVNSAAPVETDTSAVLVVHELRKEYGSGANRHLAVDKVSFSVRQGERLSVVGPSGAGKTTLLKCLSGLQPLTSGAVAFRGQPVIAPPAGLSIVFQDYARSLFPWMTVANNVRLPLKYRNMPVERQRELANAALESVGLAGQGDRFPAQLSGGMQQRVSIARALACQPRLLLMDEPFASVDAQTRLSLEDLTLRLCKQFGITLILITHDVDEAIYMGDKVLVLSPSPSVVRAILDVDLPSERDQIQTKLLREFGEMRARVYGLIHQPRDAQQSTSQGSS